MKAAELNPPILLKLSQLIVPVTDNTALHTEDRYPSWKENANTVWLDTGRMLWFRNFYIPNEADRTKWDNSPIFASDELLAKSPKTWIAVMELDILRDEGLVYGERLKKVGVPVSHKVYAKAPHQILAMDGMSSPIAPSCSTDYTCLLFIFKGKSQVFFLSRTSLSPRLQCPWRWSRACE
jgi:acetyl esterase/lipase